MAEGQRWGPDSASGAYLGQQIHPFTEVRRSLTVGAEVPSRKFPMPKLPDMSASSVKNREALTKIYKASKPKELPPAPPKVRVAKGR